MGGGRSYFMPQSLQDPETGANGRRRDGKDLVSQWKTNHSTGAYVTTRDELLNLDVAAIDSLLG